MGNATFSNRVVMVVRLLMGLMFLVFGLNGFLHFIPMPKDMPAEMTSILEALTKAGYIQVVSGTEVLVGALLIINCCVPLALTLIAPIIVGIVTFHIHIAPEPKQIAPALVVAAMELFLAFSYRHAFYPMLVVRTAPGGAK